MNHLSEEQLTLAYFEEAQENETEHLNMCPVCREEYSRLARVLDAVRAVPVPERAADYEQRLWTAIEPRVRQRVGRHPASFGFWVLVPTVAGLLVMTFLAGMYTQHRVTVTTAQAIPAKARERVLLIALGDHLDRSQVVLAELVNAPEGKPADISAEQQIAEGLVTENRLLRQSAGRTGDRGSVAVLQDLERVLVEIAHSPAEVTPEQLESLRRSIEAEGLLFKVRVVGSNAREKGMKL